MIAEKALVIYKTRPAIVTGIEENKIIITPIGEKSALKVREKDVELLHPGPANLHELEEAPVGDALSAWELLAGTGEEITLEELAELIFEEFTPRSALASYKLLEENLYFAGSIDHIKARSAAELETEEKKRQEKQQEIEGHRAFIERLRRVAASKGKEIIADSDRSLLQDVEALARGQTDKSRTLKELGIGETPIEAHRFLLAAGVWTVWENPCPARFGLSFAPVKAVPPPPPEEERLDLRGLPAFAIDNYGSDDPDDAISLEGPDSNGNMVLWVHTADPSASVTPGSPSDIEAQNRGATLYLPEQRSRMLAPQAMPYFILQQKPGAADSCALSFKLLLNSDLSIADTQIFLTRIRVTSLTYKEADELAGSANPDGHSESADILNRLFRLAEKNLERRLNTGAVNIELPEVHISLIRDADGQTGNNRIELEKVQRYRSADMVRECMILAGEGAAGWAVRNRVPFPFISQEAGELPADLLPSYAGARQIRRCMRPRILSNKPGVHWGLGLDIYTQVTSPLRRYTDLLAHQQIRAFLKGSQLLDEDEILQRAVKADAGAIAAAKAERASLAHWTSVYLADKTGSQWEAYIMENQGSRAAAIIPDLGLETQVTLRKGQPNEKIKLTCVGVNIPEAQAIFAAS
ncbi:MAG: RNB domain-containing ribonuclease [Treponema sp.]|nr:RNB domain-containing ribonuclease [Treponema sp.]